MHKHTVMGGGRVIRAGRMLALAALLCGWGATAAQAQDGETAQQALNNLLILVSGALVFWMHAGFAMLEAGLTRSKNTVNILAKNVSIVAISGLTYYLVGFQLMYPGEFNLMAGTLGFDALPIGMISPGGYAEGAYTQFSDFFFQVVFAATAATIISGAMAERVKYGSFLFGAMVFVTLIYPVVGSWHWGGGFLKQMGFHDFAGSAIVHSVGGWAALTGAIVLGVRHGKFTAHGIQPIVGHSIPLATLGVFALFFGWFGFNGGSVLAMDSAAVSRVYVITFLGGCSGGVGALATAWVVLRKPDITMILNGLLAGLVSITAGADILSPLAGIMVGVIAGALVVFAVVALDKLRVDDPVGAIPVHLVCGVWGTLAVGLFTERSLLTQIYGVLIIGAFVAATSYGIWMAMKCSPLGLRVDGEEEVNGLDVTEHGIEAYPEFKATSTI